MYQDEVTQAVRAALEGVAFDCDQRAKMFRERKETLTEFEQGRAREAEWLAVAIRERIR